MRPAIAVEWYRPEERGYFENPELDFALNFVKTAATIQWTAARGDGSFRFVSTERVPAPEDVSYIGFERNGVFYP